jgi:hypothetical protein
MDTPLPFSDNVELHTIPRKDGSVRFVWEPSAEVKDAHQRAIDTLYALNIPLPYAYGGLPGKNLYKHIQPHKNNDVFYMIDIADAYGSVDKDKLINTVMGHVVEHADNPDDVRFIEGFLTHHAFLTEVDGLPQGFPASPLLFNLYCKNMDDELAHAMGLLQYRGAPFVRRVAYTRWLDDMTFSVDRHVDNSPGFTKSHRALLRNIIASHGFSVAHHKSRFHSLDNGPVTITGLSLYPSRMQHNWSLNDDTIKARLEGRRIAPSRELITAVNEQFTIIEQKVRKGTATQSDIDLLHGYNGVLHLGQDPETHKSRFIQELHRRYRKLARQALMLSRSA